MKNEITYADIHKDTAGNIVSKQFDDIYFSKENGYLESLHVFFKHNDLPERWETQKNDFTIFETGFGTGLNFLIAGCLWQQTNNEQTLRFASVEKYPLSEKDMRDAWSFFPPELIKQKEKFFTQYNNLTKGLNILHFKGFELVLWVGDMEEFLPQISDKIGNIDSWFLDGFAPAKNPEMWPEKLWGIMAKNTAPNGTFSTFSAAGFIKRGLTDAGFQVEKVKGFGKKREMLKGIYQ